MLRAKLKTTGPLKRIVDAIKDLVAETELECDPDDGIRVRALDASHVSMISLTLSRSAFETYECTAHFNLGVHVGNLAKILKCAGDADAALLSADGQDPDVLRFTFRDETDDRTSEFELKLMDIEQDRMDIPEISFDANVEMASSKYSQICRDLCTIGDSISVSVSDREIKFESEGEIGKASVTWPCATDYIDEKTLRQEFAARYLVSFAKGTALSPRMTMRVSHEMPIAIEYPIGEDGTSKLVFYLAPKMNDDEEEET